MTNDIQFGGGRAMGIGRTTGSDFFGMSEVE